jgi:sporulation protein YlmC with PRC-barrel domain
MFTGGAGGGTEVINDRTPIEEEDVASEDRLRELEEKYEDYKVYDNQGEKIGKVDDLFVDESDREEYIGVKMGFLGMKSTLIPMDIVRVNEGDRSIEVSDSKDHVKSAPSFDDEDDTREYENHSSVDSEERAETTTEGSSDRPEFDDSRGSSEVGSTDETSGDAPTTRKTEETETFSEGDRTKIRRRVIREEIIEEEDDPTDRSV